MPVKTEDGPPLTSFLNNHNLANLTNINNSVGIGTNIKGDSISAIDGDFKTMHIEGDLDIKGKIHASKIEMTETQVILSIDYDKITEHMSHMESPDLEFFIRHLHKLKLMAEKELLDRS